MATPKSRFSSFVTAPKDVPEEKKPARPQKDQEAPSEVLPSVLPLMTAIPAAPAKEERRAFSTRIKPSQKSMLDGYVMDLKRAGWPVSQEAVLEELLHALERDEAFRAEVTARLMKVGR
ncbi:hypothetical protein [Deinococcus sp.]|uniref:hypothetical protein n=1 Tax=Deinococcus sp. TaxID=47478 RepID=UPI0025B87D0B|nr:hypothetical protein [Deinococcus sp.]